MLIRSTRSMQIHMGLSIFLSGFIYSQPSFSQTFSPPTKLSVLWEINAGTASCPDYTTTNDAQERNMYPFLGQIAYIKAIQSNPLYRLYNGSDHLDSESTSEGNYSEEIVLGSIWQNPNQVPGLDKILRLTGPCGDHATTVSNTTSLYSGYKTEGPLGYGYPRYGADGMPLLKYSNNSGIVEGSDYVAGGAIASWIWSNHEFINSHDYGRYMQSDFYITYAGNTYNPIEAGDKISGSGYGRIGHWHGSPTLNNQITSMSVNGSATNVHTTRAIPLEYGLSGTVHSGGAIPVTLNNPQIYTGIQIGKNLILNFMGLGPVGQYNSIITSPSALSGVVGELPVAYIQGSYTNFWTFNADNNNLKQVYPSSPCSQTQPGVSVPSSASGGGIILSDSSNGYAIGIYGHPTTSNENGSITYTLFDFSNNGTCNTQADENTNVMDVVYNGNLSAGDNYFTTYVINGTVTQVAATMSKLKQMGY